MKFNYTQIKNILSRKQQIAVVILLLSVLLVSSIIRHNRNSEPILEKVLLPVETKTVAELRDTVSITKTAVVETTNSAPLIARTGGRVTSIKQPLGSTVSAGQLIIQIDGDVEANPGQAQIAGLNKSLEIFNNIKKIAVSSSNEAIKIAEINLKAAKTGQGFSIEQAAIARKLSDTSVRKTELSLEDARNLHNDTVIRATDLAHKAASLAQDQATIGKKIAATTSSNAIKLANKNLNITRLSKNKIISELNNQQTSLETQLKVTQEQVKMQQIIAPISGEVVSLTVKKGDYIAPGHKIGEIISGTAKKATVNVSANTRNTLSIGQKVHLSNTNIIGKISHLSNTAGDSLGLWQVDITIADPNNKLRPGSSVEITLSTKTSNHKTLFIPLDAIVVRQSGTAIFTVDNEGIVNKHDIKIINFDGNYIETDTVLPDNIKIVVNGSHTLQKGDKVSVK